MNGQTNQHSWLESVQNCVSRTVRPCITWIPCLQRWRQVYPANSVATADSKLIHLASHRSIRVIHIESNRHNANSWYLMGNETELDGVGYKFEGLQLSNKRKSLSLLSNYSELSTEEYWFTRWNKPLKMDACSCSFRKSWRNSLVGSQLQVNQVQNKGASNLKQDADSPPQYENCVAEKCILYEAKNPSQVEPFVEGLLEDIWNEVFSYLSKIKFASDNLNHNSNDIFENDLDTTYSSSMKFESHICSRNIENFDCKTLISCQELENGIHVKETMKVCLDESKDKTVMNEDEFHSVGCVNPSFLGSNSNPDLLQYVMTCNKVLQDDEPSSLSGNVQNFRFEEVKCSDDGDSGFNTVSLESTNHHFHDSDCPEASQSDDVIDTEDTITADSNEIILNKSISESSINTVINEKGIETKDITLDNQSTITSVDIMLSEMNKTLDSCVTDSEKMSKKNPVERKNKQCYNTKHIRRLKPLLYFLHGVGCSADLWASLLQHFSASGYEVLAPDMLGHGYSSAPDYAGAYTFHRLLKDTIDIFDRFVSEHRKCVVIGHAYGCSLAAAVARYRPQQVSHLVLISGGGPAPLAPRTEHGPPTVSPCLQACLKPLLMCGFRRNILYAPCGKHIESCPAMSKGVPRYVIKYVSQGQDWPEGDATFHRRILAPTLLVHGMQDPYVTLVQECEMERTIPRSFLELIPDAGHFSMLESPKRLRHMIHCFIDWWSR